MVLLDVGFSPPGKVLPVVREARNVVVTRPPQRLVSKLVPVAAEDGVPLRGRGVDAPVRRPEERLGGVAELLEEHLVGAVVTEPVLAALNIEPDLTEADVVVVEVVLEGLNLISCVATLGAGEKINVDILHATSPGVGNTLCAVAVNLAIAAVAARNAEDVAVVGKTPPGRSGEELGDIDTRGGGNCANHGSSNKSDCKDCLHYAIVE